MFLLSLKKSILNYSFLKRRVLPILLISTIIIVVLLTIGDLGKLVEQTTGQDQVTDLGHISNCNPSTSLCSMSTTLNGAKIRLAMTIDEPVTENKDFPINLSISGLSVNKIKSVFVSLELVGEEVEKNKQYLQRKSNNETNLSSNWTNRIKILHTVNDRKDWLATIVINFNGKLLQISYQLHL